MKISRITHQHIGCCSLFRARASGMARERNIVKRSTNNESERSCTTSCLVRSDSSANFSLFRKTFFTLIHSSANSLCCFHIQPFQNKTLNKVSLISVLVIVIIKLRRNFWERFNDLGLRSSTSQSVEPASQSLITFMHQSRQSFDRVRERFNFCDAKSRNRRWRLRLMKCRVSIWSGGVETGSSLISSNERSCQRVFVSCYHYE